METGTDRDLYLYRLDKSSEWIYKTRHASLLLLLNFLIVLAEVQHRRAALQQQNTIYCLSHDICWDAILDREGFIATICLYPLPICTPSVWPTTESLQNLLCCCCPLLLHYPSIPRLPAVSVKAHQQLWKHAVLTSLSNVYV